MLCVDSANGGLDIEDLREFTRLGSRTYRNMATGHSSPDELGADRTSNGRKIRSTLQQLPTARGWGQKFKFLGFGRGEVRFSLLFCLDLVRLETSSPTPLVR